MLRPAATQRVKPFLPATRRSKATQRKRLQRLTTWGRVDDDGQRRSIAPNGSRRGANVGHFFQFTNGEPAGRTLEEMVISGVADGRFFARERNEHVMRRTAFALRVRMSVRKELFHQSVR